MSWFFLRLHIKKVGFVRSLSYGPAKQYGFMGQITVASWSLLLERTSGYVDSQRRALKLSGDI